MQGHGTRRRGSLRDRGTLQCTHVHNEAVRCTNEHLLHLSHRGCWRINRWLRLRHTLLPVPVHVPVRLQLALLRMSVAVLVHRRRRSAVAVAVLLTIIARLCRMPMPRRPTTVTVPCRLASLPYHQRLLMTSASNHPDQTRRGVYRRVPELHVQLLEEWD